MYNIEEIKIENEYFLQQISKNKNEYFLFLNTMSKFHKYDLAQQIGLHLHSNDDATACATALQWEKYFFRHIKDDITGIPLLFDNGEKFLCVYDVKDTVPSYEDTPAAPVLWKYNESYDFLFEDLLSGNFSVPEKIACICKAMAEEKSLQVDYTEVLAISSAYIILTRLGYNANKELEEKIDLIKFPQADVVQALKMANEFSKNILNPVGKYIKEKERGHYEKGKYKNSIFGSLGRFKGKISPENVSGTSLLADRSERDDPLLTNNRNTVQQQILGFSGQDDERRKDRRNYENERSNAMGGRSEQHPLKSEGNFDIPTLLINKWGRYSTNGYEVSSYGDKRFSALHASLKDGRSIEEAYQLDVKGYRKQGDDWHLGKGKPPLIEMSKESLYQKYLELWKQWATENPKLIKELMQKSSGKILTDRFASTEISQAKALTDILEEWNLKKHVKSQRRSYKKVVFDKNIEAIRTLKLLEKENRAATVEEREILQGYLGFGGIAEAFDGSNEVWKKEYAELTEVLSDPEYRAARASVLNAHFTSNVIVKNMYYALESIGFQGGTILEPSCGIGNFFAALPDNLGESHLYGVELDSLTGRMAQKIYPNANINICGFEKTSFTNNTFDLAIGNVPFGDYKVNDPDYNKEKFLIHDYFLAKMIDKVRPGGLMAVITAKGTMDKKDDKVREYLARRGELITAVRLPNNAFKQAGTDVTTDILVFQKREQVLSKDEALPQWVYSKARADGCMLNSYFEEHMENVLGELEKTSSQYGFDLTCKPLKNVALDDQLHTVFSALNKQYQATDIDQVENIVTINGNENDAYCARPYSFFYQKGKLYYQLATVSEEVAELSEDQHAQMESCIRIRDVVRNVIELQKDGGTDDAIKYHQTILSKYYDSHVEKYGFISTNKELRNLFEQDASYPLLRALELFDEDGNFVRKSDIFNKRTINPYIVPEHADTASDALAISMQEKGKVDLGYMAGLTNMHEKEIVQQLEFKSIFFDLETETYQPAEEYLSGDIRNKIEYLEQYSEHFNQQQDIEVEKIDLVRKNINALERVKPRDLDPSEIHVELGVNWISAKDIESFIFETLETSKWARLDIHVYYSAITETWRIEGKSVDVDNPKATMTYGTDALNAYKLIENALNCRESKIYKFIPENGEEKKVIDKEATLLVQQKQELLKEEFSNWIWKDAKRRTRLATYYNRYFNNIRSREYNGEHLIFPGMNVEIKLKKHQKDAIARTLYGGNTLLAHCVGAGKTYEMVASAMEAKRLKLSKKSMFAVPKHLTEQVGTEFLQLYPDANILVATQEDFEKENRKEFCSKIATGQWDAVILGYTQFEKIPISKERQIAGLQKEIDDIISGISEMKSQNSENFTIKQMEGQRKKIELRLEGLKKKEQDQILTFEELGVDRLYVDEAHYFKNLFTVTKMRNVAGITTTDAQKTTDFYEKCKYINEITNEKGLIFATGTPISNSMTEMFTLQQYLQPRRLKKAKWLHFDAWAAMFGKTVTALELSPEGKGLRSKTRFAKFQNLPELISIFKEIADIKTADMLQLPVPEAEYIITRIPPTEEQKEMVNALAERAEKIRNRRVNSNEDNMLLITNEGRKLALDQRLINSALPDNESSKVNQCVSNVFDIWQKTKTNRSTQMIFCDLSTPTGKGFNVYDDIKKKLIKKGVPAAEIEFIHNAKTEKQKDILFSKVRSGKVRVILGSTLKMGTGTNVQDKLIALHDLDVPWRPSDLEQRGGRIVRQGNENDHVKIYRYVTEGTFDAYLWQIIENKQRFISQIMTSKTPIRSAEDIDEATLSYAEIKAIATGNPLMKEKMNIDMQIEKLKIAKSEYLKQRHNLENRISNYYPQEIEDLTDRIDRLSYDINICATHTKIEESSKKVFSIILNGKQYTDRVEAGEYIITNIKGKNAKKMEGNYRGLSLRFMFDSFQQVYKAVLSGKLSYQVELGNDVSGNVTRLDNTISKMEPKLIEYQNSLNTLKENFSLAQKEVLVDFAQEEELQKKILRATELNMLLNLDQNDIKNEQQEEKNLRLQNILREEYSPNIHKLERFYRKAALKEVKKNENQWEDSFDLRIIRAFLENGYSRSETAEALFKYSPTLDKEENIVKLVAENIDKVAVRGR